MMANRTEISFIRPFGRFTSDHPVRQTPLRKGPLEKGLPTCTTVIEETETFKDDGTFMIGATVHKNEVQE